MFFYFELQVFLLFVFFMCEYLVFTSDTRFLMNLGMTALVKKLAATLESQPSGMKSTVQTILT